MRHLTVNNFFFPLGLLFLFGGLALSRVSFAEVIWRVDFETQDTSQFDYLLHPHGHSVVPRKDAQGGYMLKIALSGEKSFWWNGQADLNRSEVQYKPPLAATKPGADTYFSFQFKLPKRLSDTEHVLTYWESNNSSLDRVSQILCRP